MAKWEAEKYAAYVGLLRDDKEVTMFKPLDINVAREIARNMNAFGDMLSALRIAFAFAEDELECRKQSYLPDPTKEEQGDLDQASQAVNAIRAAIAKAEGRDA